MKNCETFCENLGLYFVKKLNIREKNWETFCGNLVLHFVKNQYFSKMLKTRYTTYKIDVISGGFLVSPLNPPLRVTNLYLMHK